MTCSSRMCPQCSQLSTSMYILDVQTKGDCFGFDSVTKLGLFPDIKYPRVPGHEIAGVIDEVGNDVAEWKVGQRVGVGWVAGSCGYCDHVSKS